MKYVRFKGSNAIWKASDAEIRKLRQRGEKFEVLIHNKKIERFVEKGEKKRKVPRTLRGLF